MRTQTKIYIAAASIIVALVIGGAALSGHRLRKLERETAAAKQAAGESQQRAAAREMEAVQFKQKIDHLERQLAETTEIRRKQDEQLEKKADAARVARADVERVRRKRPDAVDAEDLCRRLAAAGHACTQ